MVMESEPIVVGDDVGGGDDEEALEIPLSGVESRINLAPETKIVVSAALYFAKCLVLPGGRFLGYIRHHTKGGGETTTEGQTGPGGAPYAGGRATCPRLGLVAPLS